MRHPAQAVGTGDRGSCELNVYETALAGGAISFAGDFCIFLPANALVACAKHGEQGPGRIALSGDSHATAALSGLPRDLRRP